MIRIPKLIHQTWKDDNPPRAFQVLSQTWKVMLPGWEYCLWTDEMNREFVKTHYPHFLDKYDAYPNNIQRADAIRYLLLQTYGGLYVDLDFECLEPGFVTLLEDAGFMAGKEPHAHARRYGMEYIICNALMASVPNHPFLGHVCQLMMDYHLGCGTNPGLDVVASTGPFMLTNAYMDYPHKDGLKIVEPEYLYPIRLGETSQIIGGSVSEDMKQRIEKAYAIHYFFGTWW